MRVVLYTLVLLLGVTLLGTVYLVSQQAAAWRYTLTGAPGELLYAAGFDDFTDEWEQASGRRSAQIADGRAVLTVDVENDGVFAPLLPNFNDFDLIVEASAIGGPIDNGFGVLFRATSPDNYYAFYISSDGYYKVERAINGVKTDLSTWIPSDAIQQGLEATNRLRVIGTGNSFRFFVNDTPLMLCIPDSADAVSTYSLGECIDGTMLDTLTDGTHPTGRIAVTAVTTATGGAGVSVMFDNLIIYSPSAF